MNRRKQPQRATALWETTEIDTLQRRLSVFATWLLSVDENKYREAFLECQQNERPEEQVRERGAA